MSLASNTTKSSSAWFPSQRDNSSGWRFDIVGLLAVIGESTIADHTQAITASKFSWIPRLIPAPQALLRNERPTRLPSIPGIELVGVKSGTRVHELNYFANAIHDIGSLKDYEFREIRITYADDGDEEHEKVVCTGRMPQKTNTQNKSEKASDVELGKRQQGAKSEPLTIVTIPMRINCPLNVLTLLSTLMTIGLFVWAAVIHDGVCCVAILLISLSTCLACQSSQWRPHLKQRPTQAKVPIGDMVIRTRGAAFVVVHCEERITRELYAGTEKCDYVYSETTWSIMVATSTMLLMISVVLLGNCEWTMQAATGAGYIILNGLYWGLPLLIKEKHNWDMSRYKVEYIDPPEGEPSRSLGPDEYGNAPSLTRTLAYAIQATKEIKWVKAAEAAPVSDAWDKWMEMAMNNSGNKRWNSVAAKDDLMAKVVAADQAAAEAAAHQPIHVDPPTTAGS